MTEYKRVKCINCGEENPRKLHEEQDKNQVLYYSMQGTPVYSRNTTYEKIMTCTREIKCGSCGNLFKKN